MKTSEPKHILIVTDSLDVNRGSGPKANIAIIENLISCGYHVHVIHNTVGEHQTKAFSHSKIRLLKLSPLYVLGVITRLVFRYSGFNLNKWFEPMWGFSAEFFSTTKSFTKTIQEYKETVDLVITLSMGASFRPHYAMLKVPRLQHKWLAYIHDPYPFHYYPRPYNWIQPGYRQKEMFFQYMAQKAKWLAFPSQLLMEWMGSYFPEMLKKGLVIPHQISENEPELADISKWLDTSFFNLLHAGNLMKQRPPTSLIEGFKTFLDLNPTAEKDARLLLFGPADYHQTELEQYAKEIPQLAINLSGVSYSEAYWLQQRATVNVILESISEISPFLPGKFPHCIKANKPILLLSPYYSETRRLLGHDYPYWCENTDAEQIANHIGTLYEAWKHNKQAYLNRTNLMEYVSAKNLQVMINSLFK